MHIRGSRADPGWVGAVLQAALWPPWERNFVWVVVGVEHQSRADEAVVLGTPPPPGSPLPRAPALALQHPHSAQFRASCVGSGFVRVFSPWNAPKLGSDYEKPHRN